jgi:hypothetical protein
MDQRTLPGETPPPGQLEQYLEQAEAMNLPAATQAKRLRPKKIKLLRFPLDKMK